MNNYLKVIIYLIISFLSIFTIANISHHQNKKSSTIKSIIKDSTSQKDQKDKLIYNEKMIS